MIRLFGTGREEITAACLGYPAHNDLSGYAQDYARDIVVRWGHSGRLLSRTECAHVEFAHVVNPAKAIVLNCDKLRSSQRMGEVVGIPRIFERKVPDKVTAVLRPREHSAGEGFKIVTGPLEFDSCYYATEWIKADMEVRVWFCGQRTMVGKRARSADHSEYPCRSSWGYEFRHAFDPKLDAETLKAAKMIGLEVGAADVLCKDGERYFLELNSGCSVDHTRIKEFFQAALPELCEGKFEHYRELCNNQESAAIHNTPSPKPQKVHA